MVYKIGAKEFSSKEEAEKYADSLCFAGCIVGANGSSDSDHLYFVVTEEYYKPFTVLLMSYLHQAKLDDATIAAWPYMTSAEISDTVYKNAIFLDFDGLETVKEAKAYIAAQVEKSALPSRQKAIFIR